VAADGERLAIVTSLSERIAAVAAVPPEEPTRTGKADHGFDRISNVAMHALARRGMSSREMQDYLISREFEPDAVTEEIERLESVGLLDDLLLAETLVRTLRERKGLGRAALRAELVRRRLDSDALGAALGTLEDDEHAMAVEIAIKRAGQLRSYDRATATRRLVSFLQRKGYSSGIAARAAQIALAPHPSRGDGPTFQ
jgi:SOS response regulatory protein OraA/RecX